MRLCQVSIDGFRLLRDVKLVPGPGVNVISGGNAQGKTSVLEAILYCVTARSHRTQNDRELVRHGEEGFRLRLEVERRDRSVLLEAYAWQGARRFKVQGVAQTRTSDLLGQAHVVFFSPEDVEIVRGTAAVRRRFLDMALSQLLPTYLHALQQYRLILRQRNELLRSRQPDEAQLEAWDAPLVQHAAVIIRERRAFLEELAGGAEAAYARIAPTEALRMAYEPSAASGEDLARLLVKNRGADLRNGVTGRGPHRDDFALGVGETAARTFGSQGQQRTAALAVKLAEVGLVHARTGEYPVLMLDDVLSELDADRSRRLFEALDDSVQCLLTTTDLTLGQEVFGARAAHFRVEGGRVVDG
jgi:DNA replication and repair protein RecF